MLAIPQRVCLRFLHVSFTQHLESDPQKISLSLGINIPASPGWIPCKKSPLNRIPVILVIEKGIWYQDAGYLVSVRKASFWRHTGAVTPVETGGRYPDIRFYIQNAGFRFKSGMTQRYNINNTAGVGYLTLLEWTWHSGTIKTVCNTGYRTLQEWNDKSKNRGFRTVILYYWSYPVFILIFIVTGWNRVCYDTMNMKPMLILLVSICYE